MTRTVLALMLTMGASWAPTALAQDPGAPPENFDIDTTNGIPGVEPASAPPTDSEVIEVLTLESASQLRCPVCQGLSVADSKSETALTMKQRVRELVEAGYSWPQIREFFIKRYGAWILLAPPISGVGIALWAAPIAIIGIGAPALAFSTRRRRFAPAKTAPAAADEDPYRRQVLEEVEAE